MGLSRSNKVGGKISCYSTSPCLHWSWTGWCATIVELCYSFILYKGWSSLSHKLLWFVDHGGPSKDVCNYYGMIT